MPIVVALTGKKGSGKSTMARYLVEKYNFTRIPLAKKLKEIVRDEFGIIHSKDYDDYYIETMPKPEYLHSHEIMERLLKYVSDDVNINEFYYELKKAAIYLSNHIAMFINNIDNVEVRDKHARRIYQLIGTEFFRSIDDNFWINEVIKFIDSTNYERYIIDDLRFPNEYESLKKHYGNFTLISIESIDTIDQIDDHLSEQYFDTLKDLADIEIMNYKNETFYSDIDSIVNTLVSPESNHL